MKIAPAMSDWQGRVDAADGPLGKRWHQIVAPLTAETPPGGVALLGFCCDAGVARNHGRIGASEGPAALRAVLRNMPVGRRKLLIDAGDVVCQADALEEAQQQLANEISSLLGHGLFPLVMGGGHEIAYASFSGLAQHLARTNIEAAPRIGIINLDAHFDLRRAERGNSGTPFLQIASACEQRNWPFNYCCLGVSRFSNTEALFERARQLGVEWRSDEEMCLTRLDESRSVLKAFLDRVDHVYFTICMDVFPAACVPGVSAPAARGVALEVVEPLVDLVTASGKLRLADIAELNPRYDIDQRSARIAARLAARIADDVLA